MKYRQLGASDLNVSVIALSSWLTCGVGVERDRARVCIFRALELGINLIDTANVYGKGAAAGALCFPHPAGFNALTGGALAQPTGCQVRSQALNLQEESGRQHLSPPLLTTFGTGHT